MALSFLYLDHALPHWLAHDNERRPHTGLNGRPPINRAHNLPGLTARSNSKAPLPQRSPAATTGEVRRYNRLGGLIHEYYRAAA